MKARMKDNPQPLELTLSCVPSNILSLIHTGSTGLLPTKALNIFYALADALEKKLKTLKEKCRPAIIARRDEGVSTGAQNQHREFVYQTPHGEVHLTVQERMVAKPDPEKLETLLKAKDLWQFASTTAVDMEKVDGLCMTGLITTEELASVSDPPRATYALIAKISKERNP